MTIWQTIASCIVDKYATGNGRAGRIEFFSYFLSFVLFCLFWFLFIIIQIDWCNGLNLLDFVLMYIPFLFLPPLIAVCVRRLHDINRSGWLALVLLVPFLNIFGIGFLFQKGTPGPNHYGPAPTPVKF